AGRARSGGEPAPRGAAVDPGRRARVPDPLALARGRADQPAVPPLRPEVRPPPPAQVGGLAHVEHLALAVAHEVDPGRLRQVLRQRELVGVACAAAPAPRHPPPERPLPPPHPPPQPPPAHGGGRPRLPGPPRGPGPR